MIDNNPVISDLSPLSIERTKAYSENCDQIIGRYESLSTRVYQEIADDETLPQSTRSCARARAMLRDMVAHGVVRRKDPSERYPQLLEIATGDGSRTVGQLHHTRLHDYIQSDLELKEWMEFKVHAHTPTTTQGT